MRINWTSEFRYGFAKVVDEFVLAIDHLPTKTIYHRDSWIQHSRMELCLMRI